MNKLLSILALAVSLGTLGYVLAQPKPADDVQAVAAPAGGSVYDRVLASKTLRCAYASFDPMTIIDPNTKQLSGVFYDLVNEVGKRLGLKVEWVEEVNYGNVNAGFQTGRYDAFCTGLWPGATRAGNTVFTSGLLWDPVGIFVRADDMRFDADIAKLNSAEFTMAYWDGDVTQAMKEAMFPAMKNYPIGAGLIGEYMQTVSTRKADAAMATKLIGLNFIAANPGLVREVQLARPIRFYPLTIGLPDHEFALKKMLDVVIFEIQDDGTVAKTVRKYLGPNAGALYQVENNYKPF